MTIDSSARTALHAIAAAVAPLEPKAFAKLADAMQRRRLKPGQALFRVLDVNEWEYFLLAGILRSFVLDDAGHDITLAFCVGPGIVTPSIARCIDGRSQINCECVEDAEVFALSNRMLVDEMVRDRQVQRWGDAVMRAELVRRVRRELMLAAMPGKQRLTQFRAEFSDLEGRVPHHTIASYLGMSPVTLSRLRQSS